MIELTAEQVRVLKRLRQNELTDTGDHTGDSRCLGYWDGCDSCLARKIIDEIIASVSAKTPGQIMHEKHCEIAKGIRDSMDFIPWDKLSEDMRQGYEKLAELYQLKEDQNDC